MRTFLLLLFSTTLLFAEPETESRFFDGTSLEGWSGGEMKYWSAKDKTITGNATEKVALNEFLWSKIEVKDFYLVVDVKLKPNNRNAGIQFRSKAINDHGQALGYQADVGAGVWGKLYHEHGRGKLDWNNRGDSAIKPADWNRYEILAVGHRIWTAINGTLCVAIDDPEGELSGKIAFQIHGGPPQNVQYRPVKLIHNPAIVLEKQTRQELLNALPKAVVKIDPKPVKSAGTDSVKNRDASKSDKFVILNPLAPPVSEPKAFAERFEIESDQNIVIFGGANAAECNRNGWLETRLVTAFPQHKIQFRNLAWPTDTVFEQWRPRNFFSSANPEYGEKDGRAPIHADIAFLWFGQMESLSGEAKLNDFKAAYESLIDEVSAHTGRIVLVTPAPFSDPLDLGFNLEKRNADLEKYAAVIRKIATNRKLLIADLTRDLKSKSISNDGALLSEKGHTLAAEEIALNLKFFYRLPPHTDYIRESIQKKNALWRQYWMPSNWAFLYGNRQTQPSSRDHANPKKRWFPEEIKATLSKIEKLEDDIHSVAKK